MPTMKYKLLLCLGMLLACMGLSAQNAAEKIEKFIGKKTLPALTLNDMRGEKVDLTELGRNGKLTVISFWATWCIPCKKELNNIAELYEEWQKTYDVELIAVSIDDSRSVSKVKPYAEGQRWPFRVLLDINQDLKRGLNIQSVPYTLLLNKSGEIIYNHSGYVEGDELILEEEIKKFSN